MNIIRLSYPHNLKREELQNTVAAIGFFDGIHKGHQAVIEHALQIARKKNKQSAVISFHPHPSVVLKKREEDVRYITTIEEKAAVLEGMGVDRLYMITFNESLSKLSPQDFVDHFIKGLHIIHLVAGFDYTFGHRGAGNMNNINEMAKDDFTTTVIEKLESSEEKVSSTRIRNLLRSGDVDHVRSLLGRIYTTTGKVVRGDNRGGSQLGFPTANLNISNDKFLPKQGVYAVKVHCRGKLYNGMANLGVVPTFIDGRSEPKVEVNIFDFIEDIYDETITIEWHEFIREEKKFSGIEEIVAQLKDDETTIRNYFS